MILKFFLEIINLEFVYSLVLVEVNNFVLRFVVFFEVYSFYMFLVYIFIYVIRKSEI